MLTFISFEFKLLTWEERRFGAVWDAELRWRSVPIKDRLASVAAILLCWANPCCQLVGGCRINCICLFGYYNSMFILLTIILWLYYFVDDPFIHISEINYFIYFNCVK